VVGRVKTYEAIVKGEDVIQPGIPESFHVLLKELQSLGLSVELLREEPALAEFQENDESLSLDQFDLALESLGDDGTSGINGFEVVAGQLLDVDSDADGPGGAPDTVQDGASAERQEHAAHDEDAEQVQGSENAETGRKDEGA
jgi:hypothetical protein